jgi:fluoride exporter
MHGIPMMQPRRAGSAHRTHEAQLSRMAFISQLSPSAFAVIGLGAAAGAWLRWLLGLALNALLPQLPLGTLVANVVGGYLIGVALVWLDASSHLPPEVRLLVITGFLGGLTTFSSFSAESVGLLSRGEWGWAGLHLAGHLLGSLLATWCGVLSMRYCLQG